MPDSDKKPSKPHQTKSLHKPPVKRRRPAVTPLEEAKPLSAVISVLEPVIAPSPPAQTELPLAKPTPLLVKTTYNLDGIKKMGLMAGGLVLVGLVAVGYSQRGWLQTTLWPKKSSTPTYQLKVSHQAVDATKAQLSLEKLQTSPIIQQATGSVQPTTIPSASVMTSYSYTQLADLLSAQIQLLQSEKQPVATLQTYLTRAADAQTTKPESSSALLREGILLSQELQRLYLYNQ